MKRLLLYVHFNQHHTISSYVDYQLRQMSPLFSRIVFISNSILSDEIVSTLKQEQLITDFMQRANVGYDFSAWREGMEFIGFDELKQYDSVTIMNDTCFGPLYDMVPVYRKFEAEEAIDFWGMTNNRASNRIGRMLNFPEHLQSYFVCFKKTAVSSEVFSEFWQNVEVFDDVEEVILRYEMKMTELFVSGGLKYDAFFNTVDEDISQMPHPDFSIFAPKKLFEKQVPFLKVKIFNNNQLQTPFLLRQIREITDYPISFIVHHLSKIYSPTTDWILSEKYQQKREFSPTVLEKKIAIHLHTFYVDLLEEFLAIFDTFSFKYDLYLTTNSIEKEVEIQKILGQRNVSASIYVTGNVGRDILPMLKLKDELAQYDYIGHFHTKKSKEADYWVGENWRQELIDMLVRPSDEIVSEFAENKDVGIMIADIPTYFRFCKMDPWVESGFLPDMESLWRKMGIEKDTVFYERDVFVMSYGTFVWFKYDALKPLFDLNLTDEDVPGEPLPQNTILHAIERMFVYISWAQGYDFKIEKNPYAITPFLDNRIINDKDIEELNPYAYINFNNYGGIKGATKYLIVANVKTFKYIVKRGLQKLGLFRN